MKRFILFVILVVASSIVRSQQGWIEVGATEDGSLGFDMDSVLIDGNTRLVWVIMVSKRGNLAGTYTLARQWFNCTTRTYGVRSTTIRSTATHRVVASHQPDENQFTHDVVPGSLLDGILVAVC